jgi:hypothetical protein
MNSAWASVPQCQRLDEPLQQHPRHLPFRTQRLSPFFCPFVHLKAQPLEVHMRLTGLAELNVELCDLRFPLFCLRRDRTARNRVRSGQDPFTGTWVFNVARSALSTPMPRSWILQIRASESDVSHREEIIASDGSEMTVVLQATFGGEDCAVSGTPLMDTIACTRPAPHVIASTGKKAGAVTLTDTLAVSPDGEVLTLTYSR